MKKFMAIILTLAMVMSLCVVPASAAGSGVTITITPDKSRVDTATGDAVVTYTIKAKVNDPTLKVGSLTITLDPGAGLTLAEKMKKDDSVFFYQTTSKQYKYDEENGTGIFDVKFNYAPKTKTFVAAGTTQDRNLNSTHGEIVLMTIMGKIAKGTTGSVTLKTTQHSYGEPSGSTASVDCDVTPASVTIMKPPITSVSATVSQPVKGYPLDTSVNVYGATAYTADVMWKNDGVTVTGNAQADTVYTALITLKAKEGEAFSSSLNNTTTSGGYSIEWLNSTELLLTKKFDRTNLKETTGIAIDNTTLTVAVPAAQPNMEQKAELPLTAKVSYDDGTDETVDATWSIVTDPKPEGVNIEADGKLTVTNKAAGGTVEVKAAYNGMIDKKTVTITKDTLKPSAIVATAPATGTSITVPTGSMNTSGNCGYTVYDQYGVAMTGSGVTWKMEPATVAGVKLISTGGIAVESNAKTGTVELYATSGTLKSNKITFTIAREASVATSLTIEGSADSVTVPTVTEPGTTACAYASYTAIVKDQYGEEMNGQMIEWSVTSNPGVTINNGQLTVTNKATAGNVTITAKSGTLTATKTVTINKDAAKVSIVKITAQDNEPPVTTIICTGSQRLESYTATVYDQYGNEIQDNVTWSLDPATSGVTYEVSATNNNIVTLKVAPNTAAGTFKLVATSQTIATVKGELEITVQKKNDVSSEIKFNDGSLTYNGAGQKYEKASVTAGEGGTWTYTYAANGGTASLDGGLPKTVGTYTVTATYEDNSNIGSKSATLTITPKKVNIPAVDTTKYTYDGTAKTYNIPTSPYYTVSGNIQTNANEAGHIVNVTLKDIINTTWPDGTTGVQIYHFYIKKATPTGEPSYTKITAAGKTLADTPLTIGTLQPDAIGYQLQWVNDSGTAFADTTAVEKNKEYKWLFTPADTANYNTLTGRLTPYYVASSGGSHVSKVQKPEITIIGSGKADLSADGRTATITAAAGHELVSVVLNGKEMGKVEKLTGLKTGDEATITFRAKTDGKAEMDKIIAQKASKLTLMARSKKTAKLNIKVVVKGDLKAITDAGYTVKYKFYRSTKKSAGYKAVLTKKAPTYFNTYGKKGTMYYYKARVMIYDKDGNFVAQTALKQCKYANRLWTK
mgnify:CR=1 FL=1